MKIPLILALVAAALPAAAQESPWYYRVDVGVSNPGDSEVHNQLGVPLYNTNPAGGADQADRLEFGKSPLVSVGVGRRIARDYRVEAAFGYRSGFTMDERTFGGANNSPEAVKGMVYSLTFMVNAYRDFHFENWPLVPYLGAGFGLSRNTNETYNTYRDNSALGLAPTYRTIGGNTIESRAWSLAAGASFKIARLTWDLGYRYIDLGETRSGKMENVSATVENRYALRGFLHAHELTLGLRF